MTNFFNVLGVITSAGCFFYTFHVLYNFVHFVSAQNDKYTVNAQKGENLVLVILWRLFINTCILSTFMLQHSVMASSAVKQLYKRLQIPDLERSIYNACSAAALQLVMANWQPVPWVSLWDVDTSSNSTLWIIFTSCHVLGWTIIYSGCVMLDIGELSGLKQVYYKMAGWPSPMSSKSKEYQRYLTHMRHPSFIGFLIIFWVFPYMTLDRFLLACILTVYMLMMWTIDDDDRRYHATNIYRKYVELS